MNRTTTSLSFLLIFIFSFSLYGQSTSAVESAQRHIDTNFKHWNLKLEDVSDLKVTDNYFSKKANSHHVYFMQRYQEIPVYNAITNITIDANGKAYNVGHRFIDDLANKVNATTPTLSAENALKAALEYLKISYQGPLELLQQHDASHFTFDQGEFAKEPIQVKLVLQPVGDVVQLAWDLAVRQKVGHDFWSMRMDAQTGEVLNKNNQTIYCDFGHTHEHDENCNGTIPNNTNSSSALGPVQSSTQQNMLANSYNVFAFPVESPVHGSRALVTDPADAVASPYGWHDIDGNAGAEFTYTRGNNTHTYLDTDDNDAPDNPGTPDGGPTLDFDLPYNTSMEPSQYEDFSVINLFYGVNTVHDITYRAGFDEAAGNFQRSNYGNGGAANDDLIAEAHDGAATGSTNNAFYSGGSDGSSAGIHMFLWNQAVGSRLLTIDAPSVVAGLYSTGTAQFGPAISTTPISAPVVVVDDDTFNPYDTDGCEDSFVNGADVNGKIALIDRGGCFFELKVINAEAFGAVAVIICNFEDDIINMAGAPDLTDPGIPSVFIGSNDCAQIRQFAGSSLEATLVIPTQTGPDQLDGSLDNGIIIHEYGHGISNRITGGPNTGGCLGNAEQMGEGWSDVLGIMYTTTASHQGTDARGIGTYVSREGPNGKGIRRFPYSTDMSVNPLTFADLAGSTGVHAIGEVWATVVWDMYWAFVEELGFDADLYTGNGGNKMAIDLVIQGMKEQPCSPGFLDGRDGILQADMVLNNGAYQCLIWDVFARRGMGYSADQGSNDSSTDQIESFDPLPTCLEELKITKDVTSFIFAGDDIDVALEITNHIPMTATSVVITDEIPNGCTVDAGSISNGGTVSGNMVTWDLGDMPYLEVQALSYTMTSSLDNTSTRQYFDGLEDGDDDWELEVIEGTNVFNITDNNPHTGENSWQIIGAEEDNHQILILDVPYTPTGDRPALRFYHDYNTEPGADGGLVEVSTDNGVTWAFLENELIRNGYNGVIQYGTFVVPNLNAFWGDSDGYIASYVDLTGYAGQSITIRWRFGSDDNTVPNNGGWWIDDVEFMDLFNYNSEACATSDQGGNCAIAPEEGTIVESDGVISTSQFNEVSFEVSVFPNPTDQLLQVSVLNEKTEDLNIEILSTDGKIVLSSVISSDSSKQLIPINVSELASGFYFLQVSNKKGVITKKIVIQ